MPFTLFGDLTIAELLTVAKSSVDWQSSINALYAEKIESVKEYRKSILVTGGGLFIAVLTAWLKGDVSVKLEVVIPLLGAFLVFSVLALVVLQYRLGRLHSAHRFTTVFLASVKTIGGYSV